MIDDSEIQMTGTGNTGEFSELLKARPGVLIVSLILAVFSVLSFGLFAFQLRYEEQPGVRFVTELRGVLHVAAHLVRGVVSGTLAFVALQYWHRLGQFRRSGTPRSRQRLLSMMRSWWNVLATGLSTITVVALGNLLVVSGVFVDNEEPETRFAPVGQPEIAVEFRLVAEEARDDLIEAVDPP